MDRTMVSASRTEYARQGPARRGVVYRGSAMDRDEYDLPYNVASPQADAHVPPKAEMLSGSTERINVHMRQTVGNGGRLRGYLPPQTRYGREAVPVWPERDDASVESEMPFDMMNDKLKESQPFSNNRIPPEPQTPRIYLNEDDSNEMPSFESVWKSSPDRSIPSRDSKARKSALRAPRFSDHNIPYGNGEYDDDDDDNEGKIPLPRVLPQKHPTSVVGPDYEVGSLFDNGSSAISGLSNAASNDTDRTERSYELIAELGVVASKSEGNPRTHGNEDDGDDSIFDFDEEDVMDPRTVKDVRSEEMYTARVIRNQSPTYQDPDQDDAGDETSLDTYGLAKPPATNLQQRAEQVWKSRQKKMSSLRSKRDPSSPRNNNSVSFREKDTVQYFQPHQESESEAPTKEIADDRSLNSEYSKTLESEVEDMIKDVLLIGNANVNQPGRRKLMYKPEIRRRLKQERLEMQKAEKALQQQDEVEEEPSTLPKVPSAEGTDTVEDMVETPVITVESPVRESEEVYSSAPNDATDVREESEQQVTEEVPLATSLWGYVEGGINAMSEALGITETDEAQPTKKKSSKSKSSKTGKETSTCEVSPFDSCGVGTIDNVPNEAKGKEQYSELFDFAKGYAPEGGNDLGVRSAESELGPFAESLEASSGSNSLLSERKQSFDEDPRMEVLALHAAKSLHQTQGVEFDETYNLDMERDVYLSVIDLKLPLGLIFLENNGGCFVTKVSPDGSAARRGVEVGDQLAAVNGTSSVRITVDEICSKIKRSADPTRVQMSFLRYVGPFRPSREKKLDVLSFDLDPTGSPHGSFETPDKKSTTKSSQEKSEKSKKRGFRLFGRGKKSGKM